MDETAGTGHRADDRALLERLACTLDAADPLPRCLQAAACELLSWRTVDAELAALLATGLTPAGND
jgi:hypothetical protein